MVDFNKPVMTRSGRSVRVICTDANNKNYPIIALVKGDYGEKCYFYTKDAIYASKDSSFDLVNPSKKVYINVYKNRDSSYRVGASSFDSLENAKAGRDLNFHYVSTIEIEETI